MEPIAERAEQLWGLRGPFELRAVRDDPYRRTWWLDTHTGPVLLKWFGNPDDRDSVIGSLRLAHWVAQQGGPVAQLLPLRDGTASCEVQDGVMAVFEYVDGAVGVGDWRSLGRAVGRLHALETPEFAPRSYFCPRRSVPDAIRQFSTYLNRAERRREFDDRVRRGLDTLRALPPFTRLPVGIIHTDIGIAHTLTRSTGEVTLLDTLDLGVGPLAMDFPPIFGEHLSHLDAAGRPSRLNTDAARLFLDEYRRVRPLTEDECALMLPIHRAYHLCHAARFLDQALRTGPEAGSRDLYERADSHFRWLAYAEEMVPRDLGPLLGA